jgi:hypothetical protein
MQQFALEPGERIIRSARKHWFLFATGLLPYAILAVIPFAIPSMLRLTPAAVPALDALNTHRALWHGALGVWLLVVWTGAWGSFTRYFLNLWVLTNERIVDIKQFGYFNRKVSSLMLHRVQDVTTDVVGVIPSFLGIGGITVQSAGAVDEFHMRGIPHPEEMRDLILRYAGEPATGDGV